MRDLAITLIVFGSLPLILKRPWVGVIVWTWLSIMNPHRMAYGFSQNFPFAMIVALTTLAALLFTRDQKRIPWEREVIVLLLFVVWMFITTNFAIYSELAWSQFDKVIKIQLMTFVAMMLITTPERVKWFVAVTALSLGFYGVKGGIFTITHGGAYRVQGPPGTFIDGNNEIGLAMAVAVPLLYFVARAAPYRWLRPALYAATILTAIAAIGTQSRGAMVGMAAMGLMFWLKSRQKFLVAMIGAIAVLLIAAIMPPEWYERMNTINTYQQDASATGRINAWWMAFNLARSRFVGGGFETFQPGVFAVFAPNPDDVHDVHSIYFEVLGEHGFVGLGLFLLLALLSWKSAGSVRRAVKGIPEFAWMDDLAAMVQVSFVAYFTAGAFLGLAYFDLYYNIVVVIIAMKVMLRNSGVMASMPWAARAPTPGGRSGVAAGADLGHLDAVSAAALAMQGRPR